MIALATNLSYFWQQLFSDFTTCAIVVIVEKYQYLEDLAGTKYIFSKRCFNVVLSGDIGTELAMGGLVHKGRFYKQLVCITIALLKTDNVVCFACFQISLAKIVKSLPILGT